MARYAHRTQIRSNPVRIESDQIGLIDQCFLLEELMIAGRWPGTDELESSICEQPWFAEPE